MLKVKKLSIYLIFILVIIMSFISIYVGHFLLQKPKNVPESEKNGIESSGTLQNKPFPINYRHLSEVINGNRQEIHILEVSLSDERVKIKPVLSHDTVFGFESLSAMYVRSNAYAAVNAGFFSKYGEPGGMVAIDGRILTNSTGKYPVLLISNNRAELKELKTTLWIECKSSKLGVNNINAPESAGSVVLYTPEYGSNSRVKGESISAIIKNNVVTAIDESHGAVDIPQDGMLLAFFKPYRYSLSNIPLDIGDSVEFGCEPALGVNVQAYECGSWIVKDGQIVIGERDEWVGIMTNHDPRTAVGLKDDGTVVLLVVDGRQPDYSVGFTGRELGEFLIGMGVRNAAMLDGGASSEMMVNGKIVNTPSFKGQERPLGGAIIVNCK